MNNPSSNNHLYLHIPYRKDLTMRKILVISIILSSLAFAQNDGLVVTNYPSGALHTEGNYANGVRDGVWTIWYEGEVFQDYGADGEPNTQDEGEGNGVWDSTETVTLDLDGDTFFDPPQKKKKVHTKQETGKPSGPYGTQLGAARKKPIIPTGN